MKIIMVLVGNINKFPPTVSLLNVLGDLGVPTVLITTETNYKPDHDVISVKKLDLDYESKSPKQKMFLIPKLHKELWREIEKHYTDDAVIWVVTDVTVKYLGERLIGKRYVLQFLELSDRLIYYKKLPQFALNAKKLCDNALAVVVPEYNRAHILQARWGINKKPYIISNCPYNHETIAKNSNIDDDAANEIMQRIGSRKIILYQGIIAPERPLEPLIKAVSKLGDDYAFVVMSGQKNIYENIESDNFYYIPFIAPPGHLQITSHAFIGVLSYVPASNTGYSVLNTLYCAPNKVYEFAQFGVPMIGNDNPGLNYLFQTEHIGTIFADWSEEAIRKAIMQIESNYAEFSHAANGFFKKADVARQIESVLNMIDKEDEL